MRFLHHENPEMLLVLKCSNVHPLNIEETPELLRRNHLLILARLISAEHWGLLKKKLSQNKWKILEYAKSHWGEVHIIFHSEVKFRRHLQPKKSLRNDDY